MPDSRTYRRPTETEWLAARKLYRKGWSVRAIAQRLGVTTQAVYARSKVWTIQPKPKGAA
jgi:transposase